MDCAVATSRYGWTQTSVVVMIALFGVVTTSRRIPLSLAERILMWKTYSPAYGALNRSEITFQSVGQSMLPRLYMFSFVKVHNKIIYLETMLIYKKRSWNISLKFNESGESLTILNFFASKITISKMETIYFLFSINLTFYILYTHTHTTQTQDLPYLVFVPNLNKQTINWYDVWNL